MQRRTSGPRATLALALVAALALALGTAVYLLDRPAGSAWLLPSAWQAGHAAAAGWAGTAAPADTAGLAAAGTWFGAAGLWLPSLVHAFAFSVLTALMLPRRAGPAVAACLGWALVDTLFELGQHPAIAPSLAAGLASTFDGAPLALRVGRYFTQGSFDVADIVAGCCGAALAGLALAFAHRRRLHRPALPDAARPAGEFAAGLAAASPPPHPRPLYPAHAGTRPGSST